MLSARAIAVQGVGFAPALLARHGLFAPAEVIQPVKPLAFLDAGGEDPRRRRLPPYADARYADTRDLWEKYRQPPPAELPDDKPAPLPPPAPAPAPAPTYGEHTAHMRPTYGDSTDLRRRMLLLAPEGVLRVAPLPPLTEDEERARRLLLLLS